MNPRTRAAPYRRARHRLHRPPAMEHWVRLPAATRALTSCDRARPRTHYGDLHEKKTELAHLQYAIEVSRRTGCRERYATYAAPGSAAPGVGDRAPLEDDVAGDDAGAGRGAGAVAASTVPHSFSTARTSASGA